jgi:phosphinothricin acetyltransferase
MEINFRPLTTEDWFTVTDIYLQGIQTGNATFETNVPDWQSWDAKHIKPCRIVAEHNNAIIAWAALVTVSSRAAYSGVAEISIYVSNDFKGKGAGLMLLEELISGSEKEGFWMLQSVIFPENIASIKIHERSGFRQVGFREKIAKMNGVWRNTLLYERRSRITGL